MSNTLKTASPGGFKPEGRHLWRPYTQMKTAAPALEVVSGEGVRLTLADGRELIDGVSSWWTTVHGYSHPYITGAITRQVERLSHVMLGGLTHEPAERLAARLAALTPGGLEHVFFCESGSVSVEIAMKMAVQSWINRGVLGRTRFVCFRGGYHGDTIATMSVCDPEEGMHSLFAGSLPQQIVADLPEDAASTARFEALLDEHAGEIAGIVTEPLVQGAGGMRFFSPETLQRIRAACDARGLPLIVDEIMTGFGRLGPMFACEKAGIVPDVMTVSKALTGGTLPLAAAIATTDMFGHFWRDEASAALMHGPTYMANPAACAAANASLDLFEREPRLDQVAAIEAAYARLLPAAQDISGVVDVRWQGAIGVIEMPALPDLDALKAAFVEAGVWVRPFGNIVYLMPPYVISPEDLEQLIATTIAVTRRWAEAHFGGD
jgi:adenosylmethionine-8-amino-7-oxononanoate aminotransferase